MLEGLLEAFREPSGSSFGGLGRLLGLLGSLLELLGTPSGALGGSGCDILAILGTLDRILEPLGTLWASWEGPEGVLGASWEALGSILEGFGSCSETSLELGKHLRTDLLKYRKTLKHAVGYCKNQGSEDHESMKN